MKKQIKTLMTLKYKLDLQKRPLSPSSMASFFYDKEKWFLSYFKNKREFTPETEFGNMVDKKIQDDPTFIPDLPRYPLMQEQYTVSFNGIKLTGKFDGLDLDKFLLADYKSGRVAWDKKRADETIQLTFYLLLVYITKKIPPEKFRCFIHWLPTKKDESGNFDVKISFREDPVVPITFETRRTMKDLLLFGTKIMSTVALMKKFVESKNV